MDENDIIKAIKNLRNKKISPLDRILDLSNSLEDDSQSVVPPEDGLAS